MIAYGCKGSGVAHLVVGAFESHHNGTGYMAPYFTGALCGADRGADYLAGWSFLNPEWGDQHDWDERRLCKVCAKRLAELSKTAAALS